MRVATSLRSLTIVCATLAGSLALTAHSAHSAAQNQPPRFQSGVEVTSLDVAVLDGDGRPVVDLGAADFSVRVDGRPRRVVGAEWVPLTTPAGERAAVTAPAGPFSTNTAAAPGRILLIALDQQNIRSGGLTSIRDHVFAFIDRLDPADRVGVVTIGPGGRAVPFTADREQVKAAIGRAVGQKAFVRAGQHQIAIWEALAINRDDREVHRIVVQRECGVDPDARSGGRGSKPEEGCLQEVKSQADFMALNAVNDGERTLNAMRAIFDGLRRIDAPKTLLLVTDGFVLDDQRPSFVELERLAAESRTSLYALRLDQRVMDLTQRSALSPGSAGRDRMVTREGLDLLANATRGRVHDVVNAPEAAFRSIEYELSGYYLIGVESDASDMSDRNRDITVAVNRPGVEVRARRRLLGNLAPRTGSDLLATALASPLASSAVPVGAAAFSLGADDRNKVRLLIHAAVGEGYSAPASMMVGYLLLAPDGAVAASHGVEATLQPLMAGLPSPLQYITTATVDPGEYVLRIGATDGTRAGTVEHKVRASLTDTGALRLSDLIAGGPLYARESLQPTITSTIAFGSLHAFMEGYGPSAPQATVRFEVAKSESGPALAAADALVRPAGDGRAIYTRTLSVRRLPPGAYVLRALLAGGREATTARRFVISAPADAAAAGGEVFLPVPEERLAASLIPADASGPGDDQSDLWRKVDGLVRGRQYAAARRLLEEASAAWPDHAGFAKPLALLHATFGRSGDAVRMLQRHLAAQPGDRDGLALAVEWLYHLRLAGTFAYSASEDLRLARTHAAAYERLNGPETPLVQLWLDYMSSPPAP